MSGVQLPQEKTTSPAPQAEAASPAERAAGWKNPPSRMQLMLWSGSKRHVFVGMLGISVLATIPWVLLTSGTVLRRSLFFRECEWFKFLNVPVV